MKKLSLAKAVLCFLTAALGAYAQTNSARIEGSVEDQSGAVVPNIKVHVVNKQTQAAADGTTNAQGLFVITPLQPGNYTLTIEAPGFRRYVLTDLSLGVGETAAKNISLQVGQASESVQVEARSVNVQTTESQISRAVTTKEIDSLPQLARTPISLSVYQPGVQVNPGDTSFSRINGTRQGSNNTTLDGIDVNDAVVPRLGLSLTANNTDSVEEFRIITEGGKAEYGRNAGGQVELITRSGTNQFHGNGFDYLRNTDLNANDFFNNISGQARPKFIQNQFGGSFGGPIKHDKLFIFGNYQGRRTYQQIVRVRTVFTPTAKAGIFRWKSPGGAIQSYDIVANDPRHIGIDPQVAKYLAIYPDPNDNSVGDGLNTAGYRFNNPNNSLEDQFTIKGDYNMSASNHFFYRHSWQRNSAIDSLNSADAQFPGLAQGMQGGHRWGLGTGWDWTIKSDLVNEFRYGHQSANVAFIRPERISGPQIAFQYPNITIPIYNAFPQGRNSPVNEYTDNLTWIKGRHTVKAGMNIRFTTQFGYNYGGVYPDITTARSNGNTPPTSIGPTGSSVISSTDRSNFESLYNDLLGRVDQYQVTYYSNLSTFQAAGSPRVRNFVFHEYGSFIQDDWKIRRNLTLNVGLRWDLSGVPYEQNGFQGTVDKANLINASANISDLVIQRSTKWYNNDLNNFAPRFGFAWDPKGDGKMSIRGNYGIFYDRIIGATTSLVDGNTPGFSQLVQLFPNSTSGSDVRVSDLNVSSNLAAPAAPVLQLPDNRVNSIVVFNPNLRTGYVQEYSFTVQREVFRNTVLEAGYVGNRGVKLFQDVNLNQRKIYGDFLNSFKELQAFVASGTAPSAGNTIVRIFGSPSAAVSAIGSTVITTGAVGTAADTVDRTNYKKYAAAGVSDFYLRNFPQYNLVIYGNNDGRSYYDSMQLSLRRQAGDLKFALNYTWSKSIDNTIGSVDGNGFTSPIDSFNLRLSRGRSDFDRPHVFNFTTIYTLPVGKGKRFGGGMPRWADTVAGGWDLGFLGVWESGSPFTVSSGRQTAAAGTNTWANFSGDRNIGGVAEQGNGVFYFTPAQIAQFSFPGAGEIGTSGRNSFRGPRYFDVDTSLVKRFKITERLSTSFRAEAYNLFNHPNFVNPGTSLLTPATFGKISSTVSGNARTLQLALRFDF